LRRSITDSSIEALDHKSTLNPMAKPRKGAKRRRGDELKEAVVLIPLTYNDGTKVPQAALRRIRAELFAAFQGWTIEGVVKGAYRMRTGEQRVEDLQKISVILRESQLPQLESMVGKWAAQLGQETMLMRMADSAIRFILPQERKESP
jgi:hypothetical protein